MLSLGPAGGGAPGGGGKGARRGGCFTGGGGACLRHPWPWWAVPLRLSAFLCRGGLLSVRAASVAVVGCSFAPVGFSLPWRAVVSPGGIRGRGGLFLCACWLFFAVVGCCQSGRHPWPWWAVVSIFKRSFARGGLFVWWVPGARSPAAGLFTFAPCFIFRRLIS